LKDCDRVNLQSMLTISNDISNATLNLLTVSKMDHHILIDSPTQHDLEEATKNVTRVTYRFNSTLHAIMDHLDEHGEHDEMNLTQLKNRTLSLTDEKIEEMERYLKALKLQKTLQKNNQSISL